MLRARLPRAAISFFLHVAFPSSEIFRCLAGLFIDIYWLSTLTKPWTAREPLLRGMLGADLIGFQTHSYARHFRQTVSRILSVEATPKGIQLFSSSGINEGRVQANSPEDVAQAVIAIKACSPDSTGRAFGSDFKVSQVHDNHHGHAKTPLEEAEEELVQSSKITTSEHGFVDVAVFPMGIDVQSLTRRRKEKEVGEWVTALRERYKGMKMIVARDKLDEVQVWGL